MVLSINLTIYIYLHLPTLKKLWVFTERREWKDCEYPAVNTKQLRAIRAWSGTGVRGLSPSHPEQHKGPSDHQDLQHQ